MARRSSSRARDTVEWVAIIAGIAFVLIAIPPKAGAPPFDLSLFGWIVELSLGLALGLAVTGRMGLLAAMWRRRRAPTPAARPPRPAAYSREPIPAGLRFAVLRRDGFRCAYCGRGQDDHVVLHIDHLVPVARGGRNELDNLVTSCASCNLGKSAQDLVGPNQPVS